MCQQSLENYNAHYVESQNIFFYACQKPCIKLKTEYIFELL